MNSRNLQEKHLDAWLSLTRNALQPGQTVRLPVLSGSMLPNLPLGAVLEIEPVEIGDCRYGDVIVFQDAPQRLTAHRVIGSLGFGSMRLFLQKGDNNATGHWIRGAGVRGRIRRVLPADEDETGALVPHSRERADTSRHEHYRNLILYWPRKIRDFLRR